MNMFKKNGGFTLVELIVVIAILAILAGIAVPAYSGYIAKANDAADTTALGAVKTAALAAWATTGSVDEIVVTTADGKVTEVKIKGTDTETKGDDGNVTNSYKVLYTYAEVGSATEATPNWENDDFKVYMNNDMITLKGNTFKNGAVWTTAKGWVEAHTCSDGEDTDSVCDVCGADVTGTNNTDGDKEGE